MPAIAPAHKGVVTTPSSSEKLATTISANSTSVDERAGGGGDESGYGSSDEHIFSDPSLAEYWHGIYEKAGYENRHRFDPDYKWTAEEEKKLVRKIDLRIMVWAWVMFLALDLHRRNINRAISDNMLPEIGRLSLPPALPSHTDHCGYQA